MCGEILKLRGVGAVRHQRLLEPMLHEPAKGHNTIRHGVMPRVAFVVQD